MKAQLLSEPRSDNISKIRGVETILSNAEAGSYLASEPFEPPEWMQLYKPQSKKMQERWPLGDAVKIEFEQGRVISKAYATSFLIEGASGFKPSVNYTMSESGSLRSKEVALFGTHHFSNHNNDALLQESLQQSINASIRES